MWFTDAQRRRPGEHREDQPDHARDQPVQQRPERGQQPVRDRGRPGREPLVRRPGTPKAIGKVTTGGEITEFSSVVPTVASYTAGNNTLTLSKAATASGTAMLTFSTVATLAQHRRLANEATSGGSPTSPLR